MVENFGNMRESIQSYRIRSILPKLMLDLLALQEYNKITSFRKDIIKTSQVLPHKDKEVHLFYPLILKNLEKTPKVAQKQSFKTL